MDDGYFEIAQTEVSASDGGYKPRERTSPPSRVKARPQAAVRVQKKRLGYRFVKRTFDICSSGMMILLLSWLFLILAVCVKCSDGGSVFYCHKRVGKNGRDIWIPKFRTMKRNADKLEESLTPEQLEQYKKEYKIDHDPRITKLGNFLRRAAEFVFDFYRRYFGRRSASADEGRA